MIGITQVAHYIPARFESNFDKLNRFDVSEEFITEKLGVRQVSRMLDGEETSDLCVEAYRALHNAPEAVDCLVVCTQNPDRHGIPHTSAIVHGKLGLPEQCACFDISLGCSGFVYSLSAACAFMEANGLVTGLLFTADPYSKILDPDDRNTSMLFGDAATVTVLERSNAGQHDAWVPGQFQFHTLGRDGAALNRDSGRLEMNGRAVFNFAMQKVPAQIDSLLVSENIGLDEVDALLLHQGSKFMVEQLAKRLGVDQSKVPLLLKDHGNTVSSSIPLLLEEIDGDEGVNTVVMSGFGVGLSWASCVVRRKRSIGHE